MKLPENTQTVLDLYLKANRLTRQINDGLTRHGQLSFVQILAVLAISQGASQPHELTDALGWQSQTVTPLLDRLETLGWVRRERDLKDRRAVRLVVTATPKMVNEARDMLEAAVIGAFHSEARGA